MFMDYTTAGFNSQTSKSPGCPREGDSPSAAGQRAAQITRTHRLGWRVMQQGSHSRACAPWMEVPLEADLTPPGSLPTCFSDPSTCRMWPFGRPHGLRCCATVLKSHSRFSSAGNSEAKAYFVRLRTDADGPSKGGHKLRPQKQRMPSPQRIAFSHKCAWPCATPAPHAHTPRAPAPLLRAHPVHRPVWDWACPEPRAQLLTTHWSSLGGSLHA